MASIRVKPHAQCRPFFELPAPVSLRFNSSLKRSGMSAQVKHQCGVQLQHVFHYMYAITRIQTCSKKCGYGSKLCINVLPNFNSIIFRGSMLNTGNSSLGYLLIQFAAEKSFFPWESPIACTLQKRWHGAGLDPDSLSDLSKRPSVSLCSGGLSGTWFVQTRRRGASEAGGSSFVSVLEWSVAWKPQTVLWTTLNCSSLSAWFWSFRESAWSVL